MVPSVVDSGGNVDGLPNTLLEALAAARPVVASAIAGIPEVVTDDVNGLLVPEQDVDALAGASPGYATSRSFVAGSGQRLAGAPLGSSTGMLPPRPLKTSTAGRVRTREPRGGSCSGL